MAGERLESLLRQLGAELAPISSLNPAARAAAEDVAAQLRRLGVDPTPTSSHGLEALAVRFEADHPSVAAALRQVADQLGKAGI